MTTVADIIEHLDTWFPPALAESWDAIGLVCGRRAQPVKRIVLAVDPTVEVVQWALTEGADLLITHHPLYLRGTSTVDGDTPKGDVVHRAIAGGLALFVAHTNADNARPGVSDALAEAFGIRDALPIEPHPTNPTLGTGRVGTLAEPLTLAAFAARVAAALPATATPLRVAGDPTRLVRRAAVCGGAGDSLLARIDADVYVTSDLRHHIVSEYLAQGRAALIDCAHAAAESLWLTPLEHRLRSAAPDVDVMCCPLNTDPWTAAQA